MSLRPGGVTGIAILFLLAAAVLLTLGLIIVIAPVFVKDFYDHNIGVHLGWVPLVGDTLLDVGLDTLAIGGPILIVIGALDVLTFLGLLKLKKWGYWLCIIISIPIIVVIIGIIFIWYLRKDEVKAAFDIK